MKSRRLVAAAMAGVIVFAAVTPVQACTRRQDVIKSLSAEWNDILKTLAPTNGALSIPQDAKYLIAYYNIAWTNPDAAKAELIEWKAYIEGLKVMYTNMTMAEWMNYEGAIEGGKGALVTDLDQAIGMLASMITKLGEASTPTPEPQPAPANPYDDVQR